MKVLVADNERLARERLNRMVGTFDNYDVVGEAANGNEAVQKCMGLVPDIMLLDIRMPSSDGMDAAKRISQLPSPPAVIFVQRLKSMRLMLWLQAAS